MGKVTNIFIVFIMAIVVMPQVSVCAREVGKEIDRRAAAQQKAESQEEQQAEFQLMIQRYCATRLLVKAGLLEPALNDGVLLEGAAMAHGAGVHAQVDPYGMSLLWAAVFLGKTDCALKLIENKADIDARSNTKTTPLVCASYNGLLPVVEALLAHKADVLAENERGHTALAAASETGHVEVMQILLAAKAVVDVRDKNGGTALMAAASNGNDKAVALLLESKAEVNARAAGMQGGSPLLAAVEGNHFSTVQLLLDQKADPCQKNDQGFLPVVAAHSLRHKEIFEFLCCAMADVGKEDVLRALFTPKQ